MSIVQIPNLPAAIALTGTEQLEAVQAGTSVRMTVGQISFVVNNYRRPVQNVTASGALSINRALGEVVNMTLAGNVTSFSVSNWGDPGYLQLLLLQITNTGSYAINAWPANVKWPYNEIPVIPTGSGKIDLIMLSTIDGGATILGTLIGENYV